MQVGSSSDWSIIKSQYESQYGPSAAIKTDGTLWTWGSNLVGALGHGNTTDRSSPVQVGALNSWTRVSCGYQYTLAIQSSGSLWSWGNNRWGQLGQNDLVNRSSPVQVGALSVWTQISSGGLHTTAIQSNLCYFCWSKSCVYWRKVCLPRRSLPRWMCLWDSSTRSKGEKNRYKGWYKTPKIVVPPGTRLVQRVFYCL